MLDSYEAIVCSVPYKVSWYFTLDRMYVCMFESLIDRAHPQSLRLHLEVGLQLARGEVPHCRHWVFVI